MRIGHLLYSRITNGCMLIGVASVIVFERSQHWVWLAVCGVAGAVAIATYFVRHWPAKLVAQSVRERSEEWELVERLVSRRGPGGELKQAISNIEQVPGPESGCWAGTFGADYPRVGPRAHGHDPAEVAARVVQEWVASSRGTTLDLVISREGTVSIKARRISGGQKAGVFERYTFIGEESGIVH